MPPTSKKAEAETVESTSGASKPAAAPAAAAEVKPAAAPDLSTPRGRIAAACAEVGNPQVLVDVRATDLAAVCGTVPGDKADDITKALTEGAAESLRGRQSGAVRRVVLGVAKGDLTHLLERVPA